MIAFRQPSSLERLFSQPMHTSRVWRTRSLWGSKGEMVPARFPWVPYGGCEAGCSACAEQRSPRGHDPGDEDRSETGAVSCPLCGRPAANSVRLASGILVIGCECIAATGRQAWALLPLTMPG